MPPRVGNVGVGPQALRTIDIRADFGPGIGQAVTNLVGTAQDAWNAYKQTEDKHNRYMLQTSYTKWAGEQQRLLAEAQQGAEPGAPEFTDQWYTASRKSADEFLASITDPDLRDEMAIQVESVVQSGTNKAFAFEQSSRRDFTEFNLEGSVNEAATAIHNQPDLIEEAAADIADMVMTTPYLSEQEKLERLRAYDKVLTRAWVLGRVRNGQIAIEGQVGAADGTDIVSPGQPEVMRGMANAVAGVESINGRYDLSYQNANGDGFTITDFSDHPRRRVLITEGPHKGKYSTAAGRYQFTASTWDIAAKLAGVNDFTPASQDKAFWAYAQHIYERQTGRELVRDLTADRDTVKQVRAVLTPTWVGLANMSDDAFANAVLGARGLAGPQPTGQVADIYQPSDIFTDPRVASKFTFEELDAMYGMATREAEGINREAAQARKAQYDARLNNLRNAIIDGTAAMSEILSAESTWLVNASDRIAVRNMLGEVNSEAQAFQRVSSAVVNPATDSWIANNGEDKKALNYWYDFDQRGHESIRTRIEAKDQQVLVDEIVPLAQATGMLPTDFVSHLDTIIRSGDFESMNFALGAYSVLLAEAPEVAGAYLKDDAIRQTVLYETFGQRGEMEPEEFRRRIRRQYDPTTLSQRNLNRENSQKLVSQQKRDGDWRDTVSSWLGADLPLRPEIKHGLLRDYEVLFEEGMMDFDGDEDAAHSFASKVLGRQWAESSVGGISRIAWLPPEAYYPRNGRQGHDWIEQQAKQELGALNENFILVADETTRRERELYLAALRSDVPEDQLPPLPSYIVFRENLDPWAVDAQGQFQRWRGEITPEMEAEQAQMDTRDNLREREGYYMANIRDMERRIVTLENSEVPGREPEIARLRAEIAKMQPQLETVQTQLGQVEPDPTTASPGASGEEAIP